MFQWVFVTVGPHSEAVRVEHSAGHGPGRAEAECPSTSLQGWAGVVLSFNGYSIYIYR